MKHFLTSQLTIQVGCGNGALETRTLDDVGRVKATYQGKHLIALTLLGAFEMKVDLLIEEIDPDDESRTDGATVDEGVTVEQV